MRNLFEHTSASWVRYSDYIWKETKDHQFYLLPTKDAIPRPYDPMKEAENIVLAAMDIGMMLFRREQEAKVQAAMREFACKYGLLGIMTALPTTARFNTNSIYPARKWINVCSDARPAPRLQTVVLLPTSPFGFATLITLDFAILRVPPSIDLAACGVSVGYVWT